MFTNEYTRSHYSVVLCQVVKIVNERASHHLPSPTIEELSNQTGQTEENILESMEFGILPENTLLQ
ncbi:hypothetical protein [Salisediminibacterium selenitireducens]|uniref:Uncharacterized protein n=1 Tax=Bacillus selenitireducens (strain ATCC 700615 / DSM 15326 / MLS10) TaxID=439292 RepID=D6XVK7_BACIE|nr:hypothetical protein [Salisediminibacterium selenitireducens]ADH99745.1 hypothetical protein Bsel_2241 [[Bacillus] selenitireducens MLS10]